MGTEMVYCTVAAALMAAVIVAKVITVRLLVLAQDNIKDLQFELIVRREQLRKAQAENKKEQQVKLSLKHKRSGLLKKIDPLRILVQTYAQQEALLQLQQMDIPEEEGMRLEAA